MEGKMKDIEMKKVNLQQAIVSLIVMWNELKSLLNFSENKSSTNVLHNKKYGNVVGEKLKEVDLNGPPDDLAEILEIEGKRLQKMMETNKASCKEKSREIEEKLREIEFNKSFIAERANELELKQKKIDDGITDLEVKKRIFAQERNNIKGIISISIFI
ncbi:hypothetical protein POM88_000569 [Heracleum sosnowskyi]|uniref:Uncharacterized protein n=1 Tax=Heracleum sosnowskyi TaxID=360622 RepID=A0AAD8JCI3_9APIA|nr:hypothetical protein POM88_000569 [Heracleum sosnowskyi]